MTGGGQAGVNRLASEASPYLKQHMHNPVDWFPWGNEAFKKARDEDKPIFLSVGYSTCHWCHVMEHESFNNPEIAAVMNENFINIKVDREERPDVDKVYMTYVQASSGSGGWPMSCFLTPDLMPFVGATYFPHEDTLGRPGFKTVLREVSKAWKTRREEIVTQSGLVMQELGKFTKLQGKGALGADVAEKALQKCAEVLARSFDEKRGGFSGAPKFPRPSELNCLFMHSLQLQQRGDEAAAKRALQMALFTLLRMASGGIHDHVGGGFSRYSVDEFWHVPHFEKMMYDNAQLAASFVMAYRMTQHPRYAVIARDILDYVLRDMVHEEGGIFSAEDADSYDREVGSKKEGAFYLWMAAEIESVLGNEAPGFCARYMVQPGGNCNLSERSDPHNEFLGKNCLMDSVAAKESFQDAGVKAPPSTSAAPPAAPSFEELAAARKKLHEVRSSRPRPSLDNKVVAAWNGMTISALVGAAMTLPPSEASFPVEGRDASSYLAAAERAAEFVRTHLYDASSRRLSRSWCDGVKSGPGFADDYAWMICACIDLFQATGKVEYLTWAQDMQQTMDEAFWDAEHGAYFQTAAGDASILLRMKDSEEGAEPCASAVAAWNLQRLACLQHDKAADAAPDGQASLSQLFGAFGERLSDVPHAVPQLICSLYLSSLGPPAQVVVALHDSDPEHGQALLKAVHSVPNPHKVVIPLNPGDKEQMDFWGSRASMVRDMVSHASSSAVFVCRNFACQKPTSSVDDVQRLLQFARAASPSVQKVDLGAFSKLRSQE